MITDDLGRSGRGFALLIALRMATGIMLAGVYPTGMKLLATWFKQGRGLAIGVLVGALTVGSASPHLLAGLAALADRDVRVLAQPLSWLASWPRRP